MPKHDNPADKSDDRTDEEFAARLAAIDERLLTGRPSVDAEQPDALADSEQVTRLLRAEVFLQYLDHVWPRASLGRAMDAGNAVSSVDHVDTSDQGLPPEGQPLHIGRF